VQLEAHPRSEASGSMVGPGAFLHGISTHFQQAHKSNIADLNLSESQQRTALTIFRTIRFKPTLPHPWHVGKQNSSVDARTWRIVGICITARIDLGVIISRITWAVGVLKELWRLVRSAPGSNATHQYPFR